MKISDGIKGIIFDMDNTLLQSHIDFSAMKLEMHEYLINMKALTSDFPIREHTASTLIEQARLNGINEDTYAILMEIAAKHEVLGMDDVDLELGVRDLLNSIHGQYTLVVITNNSNSAALKALEETEIIDYFDLIIGREHMTSLKPNPSGFNYVKEQYDHIASHEWISIGDSWVDGKASADAGIPFISYGASIEEMKIRGVEPIGQVQHIIQLLDYIR